jgi:hypothetical protein
MATWGKSILSPDLWSDLPVGLTARSKRDRKSQDTDKFILDSAETTTKWLQNQSEQVCTAEEMLQLDEMLQQVSPYSESCK